MLTTPARLPAPYVHADNRVDGHVILYAGAQDLLLSVQVSEGDFASLRETISAR